jgi:hypothetical protein
LAGQTTTFHRWWLRQWRIIGGWTLILACISPFAWAVAAPKASVLLCLLACASFLICGLEFFLWDRYRLQQMLRDIARTQLERSARKVADSTELSAEQLDEARIESARIAIERARRDGLLRLGGAALIVAAAVALTIGTPKRTQTPPLPSTVKVQFSEEFESYLKNRATSPQAPVSSVTTLKLSDAVEGAIVANLKARWGSASSSGLNGFWLWFIICLVILTEGVLFWLALKHHPAAVPLIGTVDLIAMVLRNPEHFPHPCGWCYCAAILALIGIGLILIVAAIVQIWTHRAPTRAEGRRRRAMPKGKTIGLRPFSETCSTESLPPRTKNRS